MSAILLLIAGNFPIGSPNCLRSLAYLMQVSMILCIAPRWLARMQIRSHSIDEVNTACPPNSLPSKFYTGISQSCSESSAIGEVRKSHLVQLLPHREARGSFVHQERRNSVRAARRIEIRENNRHIRVGALLLNVFEPFRMYLSPFFSARVFRL